MKDLVLKYLNDSLSKNEQDKLLDWLEIPENLNEFKKLVEENFEIDLAYYEVDKAEIVKRIKNTKTRKPTVKKLYIQYAAAAILVGILATTYFFKDSLFNTSIEKEDAPTIVNSNTIEPGTDKAVLTLGDGSQIALEKGNSIKTQNATVSGEKIVYKNKDRGVVELVYNYLTVPRGGQFYLKLSDGTGVWLNSESQLKYPVNFLESESRQVELIYGEAYFEVSPSTDHNGSDFKVIHGQQEVQVLGTEFNIKAYKDETNIYTTLVEGKVNVNVDNHKQSIIPNQQLIFNVNTNKTTIKEVDVYGEISWKEGVFSFENKSLKEMMKVLSRWYDVDVVIKNKIVENEEFIGILRKNQNLDKILTSIKNSGVIKSFTIEDKKVVLE